MSENEFIEKMGALLWELYQNKIDPDAASVAFKAVFGTKLTNVFADKALQLHPIDDSPEQN